MAAGRTPGTDEPTADTLIDGFGALVGRLQLSPEEIHDEAELPFPKQAIVDALLAAYSLSGRSAHSPAQLQGWLLTLAQFQPGVGDPIRDPAAETARRMTAAHETHSGADPRKLAEDVAEEAAEKRWVIRRARYMGKVDQDRSRLIERLRDVR